MAELPSCSVSRGGPVGGPITGPHHVPAISRGRGGVEAAWESMMNVGERGEAA